MGATIFPLSKYGGSQYDINMLVWKDPKEGHWWMQFGNDYVLGCWPSFLFSYLADGASMIEWGGEVVSNLTATMCRPVTAIDGGISSTTGVLKRTPIAHRNCTKHHIVLVLPSFVTFDLSMRKL
ncbi:hypothetical protein ZIOFF_051576 [Zingiber officinale]|uniref:Neprosin PEP catalytic domain-containing protein n=1 Tax=Zingiber officinale TaxID=94328 RepID=A0A8J5FIY8_ZINOF|nr:hypothetical protein ZIOFF_051576 [Zingiber officinale]